MAPLKKVDTLGVVANKVVTNYVANICVAIDKSNGEQAELEEVLQSLLHDLPVVLLDNLIYTTVNLLIRPGRGVEGRWQRHVSAVGLHTALQLLPQATTTVLDLGTLFTGARLSRQSNSLCRAALVTSLARTSNLTKLVLSSKCTNDILDTLGKSCPLLTELHMSTSELVTDAGLASLVPSVSRQFRDQERPEDWEKHLGCPNLIIIDLSKCWNVSPSGAKVLLLGLKKLKRLIYSNMKSVLESFVSDGVSDHQEPFERIEYFDSSEYSLLTDVNMDCDIPETDPAKWITGPVSLSVIPKMFPNVTMLKMMLSDVEVKHLVEIPNLVHLELEFSDDPGSGFQYLLDHHCNIAQFVLLFLQVGPIQASHLLSIAQNCTNLTFLRIIGFQIENSGLLKPSSKYFQSLTQLWLSFYDDSEADSDDEEENMSHHTPEMIEFFLLSDCSRLKIVNIHMNMHHFLTDQYLNKLVSLNPLRSVTRLGLTGPDCLNVSISTVQWILDHLPSVTSMSASKWKINHKQVKMLQLEAQQNNLEVIYD